MLVFGIDGVDALSTGRPTPVPVNATVRGLPASLLVNTRFAVREPTPVGVKV